MSRPDPRDLFDPERLAYGASVVKTAALWKPRLASMGERTVLEKARRVTNPSAMSIGHHTLLTSGWSLNDLRPDLPAPGGVKIQIGNWCRFLDDFQVNAAVSVVIEDHVLAGSRVFIADSDHIVDPHGEHTTLCKDFNSAPVVIGHDTWLGQNSVVLKGVTVGHHSIVAANAVVTKDVPPCSIVGGIPARVIGSTDTSD